MKTPSCSVLFLTSLLLVLVMPCFAWPDNSTDFIECLTGTSEQISQNTYTPANPSYIPIYVFSIRNPRFINASDRIPPSVIVTPTFEFHVQAVVYCARKYGMQIRIRSGGHAFEGLSYSSTYENIPFVLLDMLNLRNVTVDPLAKTATVQAGATLGELYYYIYRANGTLAFPAGVWSTVGTTGLICGGGYGALRRKYGLAADNVLDARLVDANGTILDRESMGEDLFWAIRGGTCSSFGVILSWTLNLVDVPERVAVFNIARTLEQNATEIVYPFQTVAPVLPNELDIRIRITTILSNTSSRPDNKTVQIGITSVYLGGADDLLSIMNQRLPQLGLVREDIQEVTWIESEMINSFFYLFSAYYTPEDFLDRNFLADIPVKVKSDFVRDNPIPIEGINGLWEKLLEVGPGETTVIFTPYGGIMDEIPEWAIPFPNRNGTLFMIYERILWVGNTTQKLEWIRSLYDYLAPYVSHNPRRAYYNYDDLDLGINNGTCVISSASRRWGRSYFADNFDRLIRVKTQVDPENFFRFEQSIPSYSVF